MNLASHFNGWELCDKTKRRVATPESGVMINVRRELVLSHSGVATRRGNLGYARPSH
ncbi:MAG TPA: hypothetical protein VI306_10520 [Pyrinomonadaceae bacterium]